MQFIYSNLGKRKQKMCSFKKFFSVLVLGAAFININLPALSAVNSSITNSNITTEVYTSHDIDRYGQFEGAANTNLNSVKKTVMVANDGVTAPVYQVAKDINIIAPNVNASKGDIFAGCSVRMKSSDGVNFSVDKNTTPVSDKKSKVKQGAGSVKVNAAANMTHIPNANYVKKSKNTVVRATDAIGTTDGRLYFVADNNVSIEDLRAGRLDSASGKNIKQQVQDQRI